jgi:6,7-dimethyl-8-ribityllumazine synthase
MSDYTAWLYDISSIHRDIRIAFVVGEFNLHYTSELEKQNRLFFEKNGFHNIESYFVPGAFEIPGLVKRLIQKWWYDLIITIGVVIRGATPHFDYVCGESARAIMDLTVTNDTPIIFGILTCNTSLQVEERIGHGFAISGLNLLTTLSQI